MNIVNPNRGKHSCTQTWNGKVESVFPLLCPVKEADWVPGWEPNLVVSSSGVMEKNCIFLEPEGENEAVWVVTAYENNHYLDMYRVMPGVAVSQFTIILDEDENYTKACISYEHTSLGEAGDELVNEFTEGGFNEFMSHFEAAINHYLETGSMIGA
jgi:hypothetical protein